MPALNCPGARTVGRTLPVRAGCGVDGAQSDLGKAWEIPRRGPMPLFLPTRPRRASLRGLAVVSGGNP